MANVVMLVEAFHFVKYLAAGALFRKFAILRATFWSTCYDDDNSKRNLSLCWLLYKAKQLYANMK